MMRGLFVPTAEQYFQLLMVGLWYQIPLQVGENGLITTFDFRSTSTCHHVMLGILQVLGYDIDAAKRLIKKASKDRTLHAQLRRYAVAFDANGSREEQINQIQTTPASLLHKTALTEDTNWVKVLLDTKLFITVAGAKRAAQFEGRFTGLTYEKYYRVKEEHAARVAAMSEAARSAMMLQHRRSMSAFADDHSSD